ncbi:hypothetical protein P154DRAFT_534474 [Amniculicola lignicola CBS 123094]|uniref:Transmembrane protein n=1 Tax=Amniculicola lignicola CBS 123094 TaxID=1392246 RepID=A0A6A5WT03_9PLEO|nr:hypothetical protein P154DRAFT_534474 [Amniculicola lignicola CBS 123094]
MRFCNHSVQREACPGRREMRALQFVFLIPGTSWLHPPSVSRSSSGLLWTVFFAFQTCVWTLTLRWALWKVWQTLLAATVVFVVSWSMIGLRDAGYITVVIVCEILLLDQRWSTIVDFRAPLFRLIQYASMCMIYTPFISWYCPKSTNECAEMLDPDDRAILPPGAGVGGGNTLRRPSKFCKDLTCSLLSDSSLWWGPCTVHTDPIRGPGLRPSERLTTPGEIRPLPHASSTPSSYMTDSRPPRLHCFKGDEITSRSPRAENVFRQHPVTQRCKSASNRPRPTLKYQMMFDETFSGRFWSSAGQGFRPTRETTNFDTAPLSVWHSRGLRTFPEDFLYPPTLSPSVLPQGGAERALTTFKTEKWWRFPRLLDDPPDALAHSRYCSPNREVDHDKKVPKEPHHEEIADSTTTF